MLGFRVSQVAAIPADEELGLVGLGFRVGDEVVAVPALGEKRDALAIVIFFA